MGLVYLKMNFIKDRIYNIIRDDDENDVISNIFDSIIVFLIVINVVVIFLDTFVTIRQYIDPYYIYIDLISLIVFSLEYILRVWTADLIFTDLSHGKARIKYILTPKAIIDIIALISFYLPYSPFKMIRVVRLFRILSLLKLNRYSKSLTTLGKVLKNKWLQLVSSFFVVSVLMVFASLLMYYIENDAQPGLFDNAFSSLWWTIATITTVGYGDIYPVTIFGKILGILISLMGIGLIAIPTGIISAGFVEEFNKEKKLEENKHFCPYCGKQLK